VKPRLVSGLVLFALSCGYHDTPVATYHAPIPEQPSGQAGAAGAPSELDCAPGYVTRVPGLSSLYREVTVGRQWAEAELDCESDGGHLIVIDDAAENDWMKSIAERSVTDSRSTNQLSWLGIGDSATEGTFEWVTGASLSLALWADTEPNSLYDDEDCVEIRASGSWNDDRCDAALTYVCECDGTRSAATWCDTHDSQTCGDCATACPADQDCNNQKCQ
jgi:hypothetical protein